MGTTMLLVMVSVLFRFECLGRRSRDGNLACFQLNRRSMVMSHILPCGPPRPCVSRCSLLLSFVLFRDWCRCDSDTDMPSDILRHDVMSLGGQRH